MTILQQRPDELISILRPEFSGTSGPGGVATLTWGKILYIPLNGGVVQSFPVTQTGRDAACAAALSGAVPYIIWVPTCNIPGNFTVPALGVLVSMGNRATFTGVCTLGLGAGIKGITVSVTGASAGDIVAVVCSEASQINFINDCGITATNSGVGNAYALDASGTSAGNTIQVWNSQLYGNATGGGDGYGINTGSGQIYMEGGWLRGSTSPSTSATGSTTNYISDVGLGKGLDIGAGGAEPASWYDTGFDDSLWTSVVVQTGATPPDPPAGSQWVTFQNGNHSVTDWLYRREITLAAGAITSATITVKTDDAIMKVYAGGTLVFSGLSFTEKTIDVTSYLVPGSTNTIGIKIYNSLAGSPTSVAYTLSVTSGTGIVTNAVRMDPVVGEPTLGDKGVWNVTSYPDRHARDIDDETYIYHKDPNETQGDLGIFNVKDYGAVGDGVTNDTTAVQDAADAATVGGGIVWYPPGSYLCDPLTTYINVQHLGSGMNVSKIIANSAGSLFTLSSEDIGNKFVGSFKELDIDGNSTGTNGVDIKGVHSFFMERVHVHDFTAIGVKLRAVLISYLYACEIQFNGTRGIQATEATLVTSGLVRPNLLRLLNTKLFSNTEYGMVFENGSLLVLDNSDIELNGTTGNASTGSIYAVPYAHGLGVKISNCWFEANKGGSEVLINTPGAAGVVTVIENTLFAENTNCTYGIYVEGATVSNKVICREVVFYNGDAATADFFANGTNAFIERENCTGTTGGTGTFTGIIHDNVGGEINALTEKATPVSGDLVIIEDSAASYAKKKAQLGNLPGGSGGTDAEPLLFSGW